MDEEENSNAKCEESDDGEAWLLSYADLMTLLACFFILMMVFANYDPVGFQEKSNIVAQHFAKNKFEQADSKLKKMEDIIQKNPKLKDMTKMTVHDSRIELTFKGGVLFNSGDDKISDDVLPVLDSMIESLYGIDPNFKIVVEGHTDSIPLPETSKFHSNWHLSSARASSIVNRFELFGFNSKNLRPLGLGPTDPLAIEKDKDGKYIKASLELNRRVVVKVLLPEGESKNIKMGLGVYFKDEN